MISEIFDAYSKGGNQGYTLHNLGQDLLAHHSQFFLCSATCSFVNRGDMIISSVCTIRESYNSFVILGMFWGQATASRHRARSKDSSPE